MTDNQPVALGAGIPAIPGMLSCALAPGFTPPMFWFTTNRYLPSARKIMLYGCAKCPEKLRRILPDPRSTSATALSANCEKYTRFPSFEKTGSHGLPFTANSAIGAYGGAFVMSKTMAVLDSSPPTIKRVPLGLTVNCTIERVTPDSVVNVTCPDARLSEAKRFSANDATCTHRPSLVVTSACGREI